MGLASGGKEGAWRLLPLYAAAAAVSFVVAYRLWPRPSLQSAAQREVQCEIDGDAGCIEALMDPEEEKALGVDAATIEALFGQYLRPAFAGTTPVDKTDFVILKDYGEVIAMRHTRGKVSAPTYAAMVAATPSGARSVNTIRNLVFAAFGAKYRRGSAESNILVDIEGITRDGAQLSRIGIKGIYDSPSGGMVPWDALLASYRKKAIDHGLLAANSR